MVSTRRRRRSHSCPSFRLAVQVIKKERMRKARTRTSATVMTSQFEEIQGGSEYRSAKQLTGPRGEMEGSMTAYPGWFIQNTSGLLRKRGAASSMCQAVL